MSKHINAGDTLTVGDLTDDHVGAVIEVGPIKGVTYRLRLDRVMHDGSKPVTLLTAERGIECAYRDRPVTVITPPPVVQPDEPTELGQCIRIEGESEPLGVMADPTFMSFRGTDGSWFGWSWALKRADDRQIIVSDPPRWPDETPEADETLPEVVETLEQWDALPLDERRKFTWANSEDAVAEPVACGGWWYRGGASNLGDDEEGWPVFYGTEFPLTRGERVE